MKRKTLGMILAVALCLCALCGCGGGGGSEYEVGKWERQKPQLTASLGELNGKSLEFYEGLNNQYVKLTFELAEFRKAASGLYYNNQLVSERVAHTSLSDYDVRLNGYTYQNYWEIPFGEGDRVTVDGYCRVKINKPMYFESDTIRGTIEIYVDPCFAEKS